MAQAPQPASFGKPTPKSEIMRNRPASAESVALSHRVAGLETSSCRSKHCTLVIPHSRKAHTKCSALSRLAGKVDCTIVKLDNPEGCGQTDPRAGPFGGGGKLEHE